jgi:hypothetical protein
VSQVSRVVAPPSRLDKAKKDYTPIFNKGQYNSCGSGKKSVRIEPKSRKIYLPVNQYSSGVVTSIRGLLIGEGSCNSGPAPYENLDEGIGV